MKPGEAADPVETLLVLLAAEQAVLVPLRGDVLLPLALAVTVLPAESTVEATLARPEENG